MQLEVLKSNLNQKDLGFSYARGVKYSQYESKNKTIEQNRKLPKSNLTPEKILGLSQKEPKNKSVPTFGIEELTKTSPIRAYR